MLEEIAIENLGVIREARVTLSRGLTVITGETGAGKTMVLTGLGLLMGGKADPGVVRPGASSAAVEGRWQVAGRSAVAERVEEAGGSVDDDGTVVVLRTVAAGRSRAHLGGRSVPQGVLAEIADELATVHGQADQLRLRTASKQREALDAFAGPAHLELLGAYRAAWSERTALEAEIADLTARAAERAREAELLRLGLAEVERVDPRPGEDAELQALVARLGNVEALRVAATEAHEALAGEPLGSDETVSAVEQVTRARRALESAAADDPALGGLATRVAEAGYLLADVATELSAYVDDLQADPGGLEVAHARLAELTTLTRTYGETVDDVLRWASDAGLRLLDLDDGGERLRGMTERTEQLDEEIVRLGGEVTAGRRAAGARLAEAVTGELAGLAMGGARLEVDVEDSEPGPWGADQVTFALVPHPGAPARPLGKGASGGELSRVMLALEVALATAATERADDGKGAGLPTFVFDEVDAGVGGRAAVEVGRRLAVLARSTQVIVVTHLAQVAAFADAHLVVTKSAGDEGTVTGVREVTDDERVRELARMLSGQEDSEAARTHALELLESSTVGR
ncbi:DNA repair protein RecN [Xylanimonas oleitrophica]|uniref:DNA repair protein RecN n=1 Tax=Xylanimonas oleitrophica TaxID=2607479 RepID=A0A2W5WLY2_9MICO|nr:DNA repair protein RecN [Xylanimonas oleitrophica]PZR52549.1 DNA repair protein RecN [Xylanimonas oleitrophica]